VAEQPDHPWRATLRRRLGVAASVLLLWSIAIEARLVYFQVVEHDSLVAAAERQQSRTIDAPAKRGEIVDRRGRMLAYSVDSDTVYAVPSEIQNADTAAAALCTALGDCKRKDRELLAERLGAKRYFSGPGTPHRRAGSRGRRLHEGEPPLLSEQGAGGARARLRRAGQ
jgi:cell division protein FtsI (penicillin-binding protein 3)